MIPIARRNLLHDRAKLATALIGVIFAVLLVTCLGGLFIACSHNATGIIDHAGADLWIVARATRSVDLGEPISLRRLYQAQATPGVLWAEPLAVQFSQWRLPDGRQEVAQIVGLAWPSRLDLPWAMADGQREVLGRRAGVIIDERERERFGGPDRPLVVGDQAEILDQRVTVSGFSRGVGSFTTIPYVFTSHKQAQRCTTLQDGETTFVLVKTAPGSSVDQLRQRLAQRLPDLDVFTTAQFARMSRDYWLFGTGVGMGMVFAAVLGLLVGGVIVSQTIYASTMDRLTEYGTLKALGMGNRQLGEIVLQQAMLVGLISYAIGAILAVLLARRLQGWNLIVEMPPWLFGAMLVVTLATCAAASVTSVAKVFRLPPAAVFRS